MMAKIDPNTPVTYKILMGGFEYLVDRLGEMMDEKINGVKNEVSSLESKMKKGFTEAKKERQRIELELKRQINDLKADTPPKKKSIVSIKELLDLKLSPPINFETW